MIIYCTRLIQFAIDASQTITLIKRRLTKILQLASFSTFLYYSIAYQSHNFNNRTTLFATKRRFFCKYSLYLFPKCLFPKNNLTACTIQKALTGKIRPQKQNRQLTPPRSAKKLVSGSLTSFRYAVLSDCRVYLASARCFFLRRMIQAAIAASTSTPPPTPRPIHRSELPSSAGAFSTGGAT